MKIVTTLKDAWRKNGPELRSLIDGSMPSFVVARRPADSLDGVPVFHAHVVETDSFAANLQFLRANGYRTLRGREFADHLQGTRPVTERAVLLTFDDGPRNFHDVAYPVLRHFGAHAVAFIAPGLHADDEGGTDARPMTWAEIGEIHASGLVEFHSHTLESRFVPGWPQPAALADCDPQLENSRRRAQALPFAEDLAQSVKEIESRLPGAKVEQLCFPQYIGTQPAAEAAIALGFRACHWGLIKDRPLNRSGDSPLQVSRLSDEFVRRLPGTGRMTLREIFRERLNRIERGRAWRRRFPDSQ